MKPAMVNRLLHPLLHRSTRRRAFLSPLPYVKQRVWLAAACTVIALAGACGLWAALEAAPTKPAELSAMLPQGALLTIEARDFNTLLKTWNSSAERALWLKSDNFSVFSRSRLFGRLGEAQGEFAQAAGVSPDMAFLQEVAGRESIFAWYDVGRLEFLYITRMPNDTAEKSRLLQMRGKFSARVAGGQTFYVKTQAPDAQAGSQSASQSEPRTVAFATSGDWLLLSTREDLMAGALTLMASAKTKSAQQGSVASEAWFADAHAATREAAGALRMTLNLEKIVPLASFRTYWVQRNITEMKQFRSAVTDLYLEKTEIREERVLLPKASTVIGTEPSISPTQEPEPVVLSRLTALLPERIGVYRASAFPTVQAAVGSVNEKLLERGTTAYTDAQTAPSASLNAPDTGSTTDLETRIDTEPAVVVKSGAELMALREVLDQAGLNAIMTADRTGEPVETVEPNSRLYIPIESAIVLSSTKDFDTSKMQAALRSAMGARVTTSGLGLAWKAVDTPAGRYFAMDNERPLQMAVRGRICVLTDSSKLMAEMLSKSDDLSRPATPPSTQQDILLGSFHLAQERKPFARWTTTVDHALATGRTGQVDAGQIDETDQPARPAVNADNADSPPAFFARNLRSLTDTFAALDTEEVVERRDGALTRQTVTYLWRQ